jgi:hypothetical protein
MLKDAPMSPTRPSVRGTTLIRTTSETGDVPWQHALNGFGFKGFEVCRRDTVRDAGPDSPGSRQERTRDRVPLDWAQTQTNLGIALEMIGNKLAIRRKTKPLCRRLWLCFEQSEPMYREARMTSKPMRSVAKSSGSIRCAAAGGEITLPQAIGSSGLIMTTPITPDKRAGWELILNRLS